VAVSANKVLAAHPHSSPGATTTTTTPTPKWHGLGNRADWLTAKQSARRKNETDTPTKPGRQSAGNNPPLLQPPPSYTSPSTSLRASFLSFSRDPPYRCSSSSERAERTVQNPQNKKKILSCIQHKRAGSDGGAPGRSEDGNMTKPEPRAKQHGSMAALQGFASPPQPLGASRPLPVGEANTTQWAR